MANRRQLKKQIHEVYAQLAMTYFCLYLKEMTDKEKAAAIVKDIDSIKEDFLVRVSHTEKHNAKAFYRQLEQELNERIERILSAINIQ